jgi:RNA ligase (TIGR02306 family)
LERKLATIRKISEIRPIPNADALELAIVDGWRAVVKKGEYEAGDLVVYCEIDSFLPIKPEYEFLRKSCYRKMTDGTEGFRIKTIKLRGQLSQGLVLPLPYDSNRDIGQDVTEELGITKFEVTLGCNKAGSGMGRSIAKGNFPFFVPKTDEERIQNLKSYLPILQQRSWTVTEKLDGTSFTTFNYNGEFGVCSRNLQLLEDESSIYWKVAKQYNLQDLLESTDLAIQGEILAPGIQDNKYKLEQPELYVFNVYDISKGEYLDVTKAQLWAAKVGLKFVPVLNSIISLPDTIEEILADAEDKSQLNDTTEREGLVYVTDDGDRRMSFKVISNKFLLKED